MPIRMLGLERNKVRIVPYQNAWVVLYKEIEKSLSDLLKDETKDIAHVGSTAIIGMAAKPIIDIAVAIRSPNSIEQIQSILSPEKYEYRGPKVGGYLFVKRENELTTQHIHFVLKSSKEWADYLSFRDQLNSDEKLRKQYAELKQKLAKKYTNHRGEYTKAKNEFISKVLLLTTP
ncbi:MAG: GrpB family protein [Bacteroidota bacterium]